MTCGVMGGKSGKIAARDGNEVAMWVAKTARFGAVAATSMPLCSRLATSESGAVCTVCGCSGASGAGWAAMIE